MKTEKLPCSFSCLTIADEDDDNDVEILSVCLSVCLSLCLFVCLSVCLSSSSKVRSAKFGSHKGPRHDDHTKKTPQRSPKIHPKQSKHGPKSGSWGPPEEPKKRRSAKGRFFSNFFIFFRGPGNPKLSPKRQKVWSDFCCVFRYAFWDVNLVKRSAKQAPNSTTFWLKSWSEGIMLIFGESAYFIGPADVPGGSCPSRIFEHRQI